MIGKKRKSLRYSKALDVLIKHGIAFEELENNQITIAGKFLYATTTGRWRQWGRSTWYRSNSLEGLIEKLGAQVRPKNAPKGPNRDAGEPFTRYPAPSPEDMRVILESGPL